MADNPDKQSFCLIDGTFSPDEARQILMTLVQDKISFHRRNDWSDRERQGEPNPAGGKRINELRATREKLDTFLAQAESQSMELVISCNIDISLRPR